MKIVLLAVFAILMVNMAQGAQLSTLNHKAKVAKRNALKADLASKKPHELYNAMMETAAKGDADGLKTITDLVKDTLIPLLHSDVAAMQKRLDDALTAANTCATDVDSCKTSAEALKTSAETAKADYDAKKAAQSAAANFDQCVDVTFSGDSGADDMASAMETFKADLDAQVTKYNNAAIATASALASYNSAHDAHSAALGECKGKCEGCVTGANTAYADLKAESERILPGQQDDLRTYELIQCVAVESAGANDATSLQACRDAETDVSSIKYTYGTPPTVDCSHGEGGASSGESGASSGEGGASSGVAMFDNAYFYGPNINHGTPIKALFAKDLVRSTVYDNWRLQWLEPEVEMVISGQAYGAASGDWATCLSWCENEPACKQVVFEKTTGRCFGMSAALDTDQDDIGGSNTNFISAHCNQGDGHVMLVATEDPLLKQVMVRITGPRSFEYIQVRDKTGIDSSCTAAATYSETTCFSPATIRAPSSDGTPFYQISIGECEPAATAKCQAFPCVDLRESYQHHHPMWLTSAGNAKVDGEAGGIDKGDNRSWDCTCASCDGLVGTWSCPGFYSGTIKITADYANDFTTARTNDWMEVCTNPESGTSSGGPPGPI